tara:strand:+ start:1765 stop:1968 length:204 start_codon:yes stop_codon:yes gene_type:complete
MSKIVVINNSNVMSDFGVMASVMNIMDSDPDEFPIVIALTSGGKAIIRRTQDLKKTKYTIWDIKGDS